MVMAPKFVRASLFGCVCGVLLGATVLSSVVMIFELTLCHFDPSTQAKDSVSDANVNSSAVRPKILFEIGLYMFHRKFLSFLVETPCPHIRLVKIQCNQYNLKAYLISPEFNAINVIITVHV